MSNQEKIRDPYFWEELWMENLKAHTGKDPAKNWNKRAQNYKKTTQSQEGQKRVDGVIGFLQKNGVIFEGKKILDIGCGPGTFAIPFAQMGAEVVALDPAQNMLDILEKEKADKLLNGIKTDIGLWEELDIHKKGWYKEFDLVFASNTPGLRDQETLQKIMDCSKEFCFASGFDGKRQMSLFDDFWLKNFRTTYTKKSADIIFLINLLYALEFRPTIEFLNLSREETYDFAVARESILALLQESDNQLEDSDSKINHYLNELAEKGQVKQFIRQVFGLLLWKVK